MTNFKSVLLVALVSLVLLQLNIAADNCVKCERTPSDGLNAFCTLEYNPVCAYKEGGTVGQTAGNPCQACKGFVADYYLPGPCENTEEEEEEPIVIIPDDCEEEVEEESSGHQAAEEADGSGCEENSEDGSVRCNVEAGVFAECASLYEPVCAYFDKDTSRENGVTAENTCLACYYGHYDYYLPGRCPETEPITYTRCNTTGTVFGAVDCIAQYEPVCGHFDNDTSRTETASNACTGCFYQFFDYYAPGACPPQATEEEEEEVLNPTDPVVERCPVIGPNGPLALCIDSYEPVCAFRDGDSKGTTVTNNCVACYQQQGYDYYIDGECQ